MAILHKNINNESDIHVPKWLPGANNGDYAFKNEKGELESIDELLLPAALNFVDGSVAPPTTSVGDIYILSSGGSVNAGWGSVALQDWVRYDGALWNSLTPQKSSLCYDKTADALMSFNGTAWAAIGGGGGGTDANAVHVNVGAEISAITAKATPTTSDIILIEDAADSNNKKKITIGDLPGASFGKLGIADSLGEYTFYDTFALALSAASSGDTIQMFTDIIETSNITVTCVNNVNINFNGFTYTLNTSGTANAFTVAVNISLSLFNGRIKRTGGTSNDNNSFSLFCENAGMLKNNGMVFENDFGHACRINSGKSVIGGTFDGFNIGLILDNSTLDNAFCLGNNSSGISVINSAIATNCNGYSKNFWGILISVASIFSCIGRSDGNYGINILNAKAYDSQGYSSADNGINMTGNCSFSNLLGYSTADMGVKLTGTGNNITGHSLANSGIQFIEGSGTFVYSNVNSYSSTSASMQVTCNGSASVEFNSINITTISNLSTSNGINVGGTSNDVYFNSGTISVKNSSAFGIFAFASTNCYFVNLIFINSSSKVNGNLTNLQSNTPDSFGNILIG